MAANTEFRNAGSRFGSTIRQSLDMITGHNVSNYTLIFLDSTKHHKRGESKNIVVPYIVLGRDPSCHVQFGDEFPTVSRQHASIQSDERGFTIIHNPQATNPTYVDGRPIIGSHKLESGDEIQLSQDGPKIRFVMDKSAQTSTIGFTRRMSMAIGQSLRPYKTALYFALVLLIAVIGYSVWSTNRIGQLSEEVVAIDSLQSVSMEEEQLKREAELTFPAALKALEDNIYYIQVIDIKLNRRDPYNYLEPNESTFKLALSWSGTGFLTSDGKFITARHVIEHWNYPPEDCSFESVINNFINDGGKVTVTFRATSSSNHTFTFTNEDLKSDKSSDEFTEVECNFSQRKSFKLGLNMPKTNSTDWAYFELNIKPSTLKYERELSKSLTKGETLFVLGYPLGLHLQSDFSKDSLEPVFSRVTVGQTGIKNGLVNVSENSLIGGHSGAPVFARRGEEYIVVGIVSSSSDKIGQIVPIANIW